ncbi:MAG: Lrp/AsnC family transcriptional regulator [Parvularculaceae bacterium]|nr:Lrp/AsnC family transcriptional regulator [Parvularculaceae bacterium]
MLDEMDRKLLALLQADGRLTNAELAERVALSQSACHRRVKRPEELGVIAGYAARVDRRKIGLNVMAYVFVKLDSHAEELTTAFARAVDKMDEVIACHAVAGVADYVLVVVADNVDAFADVALKKILRLPGVKDSTSNFVLATLKQGAAWPMTH